jgi:signal transduction histidine kinase/CheY-like chemotaxis protein
MINKSAENQIGEKKLLIDIRPEWTMVTLGRDFKVTAAIIDRSILVTKSSGFSTSYDIGRYREFIKTVLAERYDSDKPYIHVMEWSDYRGCSIGARKTAMRFVQSQPHLRGILICNASAFLQMMVRINLKFFSFPHPIKFCVNLDSGIRFAGTLLYNHLPDYYELPSSHKECKLSISKIIMGQNIHRDEVDAVYRHRLSDEHSLEVRRIGTGVLYCAIQGSTAMGEMNTPAIHTGLQRAVLHCMHNRDIHVQIWDCSNFNILLSRFSKRRFFKGLFDVPLPLLGCIIVNTESFSSASAQWRLLGNRPIYPVIHLTSLTVAILKAQELLKDAGYAHNPATQQILSLPKWHTSDASCSIENEIIDDSIIHTRVNGAVEYYHIHNAFGIQQRLAIKTASLGRPYYVVVGVQNLRGASYPARKYFIRATLKLFREVPFRIYIFYGAKGLNLAGINLARHRAPYRIMVAQDLKGALSIVRTDKLLYAFLMGPKSAASKDTPTIAPATLKRYVDDILFYLSTVSWKFNSEQSNRPRMDPSHPFAQVFDAIDLIRDDLSLLYHEQQKAHCEQVKLETRLAQSKKIEALGLLTGGVAHDLNNVLSGIVTYPDFLLQELDHESSMRKPLMQIRESGEKAAAIVQDLLTLARRGTINTSVLNLNTLINEYLNSPEHQVLADRHPSISIETDLSPDLYNISGLSVHLKKVIMNLTYNAFEASHLGCRVSIRTYNQTLNNSLEGYEKVTVGNYAAVEIVDRGVGIAPDDLKRIFEPFFTRKKMGRSGTGLGMAVVWGTVQDHGGYVTVASTVGKGTTFHLFFPATRSKVRSTNQNEEVQSPTGNGQHILVVDDIPDQLQIASVVLKRLGYTVSVAASGEAALDFLKANAVDLVIIDMVMETGMDGLDVLLLLRQRYPEVNAIMASGFAQGARLRKALSLTGTCIRKPYTVKAIATAVKRALSRELVQG